MWRMISGGLVNHWKGEMISKAMFSSSHVNQDEGGSGKLRPITSQDMQGAFYVLLIGYFLSSFAFFLEIVPPSRLPSILALLLFSKYKRESKETPVSRMY